MSGSAPALPIAPWHTPRPMEHGPAQSPSPHVLAQDSRTLDAPYGANLRRMVQFQHWPSFADSS